MKIPVFKPSKVYVHDSKVPCLVAKLKNSLIAGLGKHYRKEIGKDPVFPVYLRGANAQKIPPWQQRMLQHLFEREGLVKAIAEGMRDYEKTTGYEDSAEIERDGILPHLYLTRVLIDELWQEVIICAHTLADGNLDEHGIAIHLKKGRWKFGTLDYLAKYIGRLSLDEPQVPSGPSGGRSIRDLHGNWVLDAAATSRRLTAGGMKSEIKSTLNACRDSSVEIGKGAIRLCDDGHIRDGKIVRCQWKGKEVTLTYRIPGQSHREEWGGKFQNGKLVSDDLVFRRLAPGEAAPVSVWTEMDPAPLFGIWENKVGNGAQMTFTIEITRTRIRHELKLTGSRQTTEFRWSRCFTNGAAIRLDTRMISKGGGSAFPMTVQLNKDRLQWETWLLKRKQ